jgi:ABC-type polysaccharide/polyol phosphate transport system ATPase subunit/ABC-type polysaccharide/polyol phosphate export permease
MRHPLASFSHDHFEALRDVSFDVQPGEFFAVIGRNGSGKSTLLRCIAGIYELDGGAVDVDARIAPFIELGVGFNPQLNAPDNVAMAGTMMGLRPAEARKRFPEVISFAELEDFADMPLATYSSGMQVRLGFSTSFRVDADVLLFDEVLAVGDAMFQRKCMETFERLIAKGHTIIYVSHSLDTIEKFADRALLLERGRVVELGEPAAVIERYEQLNRDRERRRRIRIGEPDGYAEIMGAWLESAQGARTSVLRRGEEAQFRFVIRLGRDMERPGMGFALRDADGAVLLSETDRWRTRGRTPGRSGDVQTFSTTFPSRLDPGTYEVAPLLAPAGEEGLLEVPGSQLRVQVEPPTPNEFGEQLRPGKPRETPKWWDARRFADLTLMMARTEFKLRYLDSVVGYLWALGQPLLMFSVLYLVWRRIVPIGTHVPHYELNLLLGIVFFMFFTEATGHALPSLVVRGTMLRKIPFPPIALPLSSVLTSTFVFAMGMIVVLGFILAAGILPDLTWLELIPLTGLLVAFIAGISMLLSLLYVPIRDVQPIWVVVARMLFFLTPVFYPIELAPSGLQRLLVLNPLAIVIVQARHALIDPSAPTAADAAGGPEWIAASVAFTAALVAAGLWLYHRRARRLVERI